ncbi:MAG TPA: hypothetical protein VJP89_05965 [Pyrinomonadaceae bacterium]|nr:hypothetical protein [Pyrinomonadaceae bacterium]
MFDFTSRYYSIETVTYTGSDGRTHSYKRRRFVPQGDDLPVIAEATVTQSDRLDIITARTLGDPLQFWRVGDANNALNPFDLTKEAGRRLKIPMPGA